MKKNRHMNLKAIVLLIAASFTFSLANAQEVKEEKTVMIKMVTEEDGNISLDTTIILDEDFDGDWTSVTDDEELLKKLEELDIDLDLDGTQKVYMIKAPETSKKAYFYSVEIDDEGEVVVEVEGGSSGSQNVWVSEVDGDSTITIVLKSEDCKHKNHDGEHKMVVSKTMNVEVETEDGDTVITYTIKTGGEEGEEDVMIWHSDDNEEISYEILMKQIEGDSSKIIIMTTGKAGEEIKVVKHKEVIIITEEVKEHDHDCDHDHDKDKKKKKKKDDD
ncbi:MAG: hypothetical protein DRJ15_04670 [Bacteroidetes bacterium]|nr:MAG: hypothetical protein DRJ15_04670 [Bacteroidota bacterium]